MKLFDEIFGYKCPICNITMHKDNPYYCQSIDHEYGSYAIRLYSENMVVRFRYMGDVVIFILDNKKTFNIDMEDEENIIKNLYQIVENFQKNLMFL